MQNIFGSHMPKKTFLHTSHVPLLNWRRPETCKAKQNSSTCHAHFFKKIMHHAGQNTKNVCLVLVVPCDMQKKRTCSGVLSSSTNCGQNGLCQFFVIHTGCCPVDIVHPCMFLTLAPTKTPCEQIAKTS